MPADEKAKPNTWQRLAEVPATSFGGEPTGNVYSWLDETAKGTRGYEYQVVEIEVGGERLRAAQVVSGRQ